MEHCEHSHIDSMYGVYMVPVWSLCGPYVCVWTDLTRSGRSRAVAVVMEWGNGQNDGRTQ